MEPQEVGGWLDYLKDAIDLSKVDKAKWKSSATLFCDGAKVGTKLPFDFDDTMWDMLADALHKGIDRLGPQQQPDGPITVGAAPEDQYVEAARDFDAVTTDAFLSSCEATDHRKDYVRRHKRVMKVLYATDRVTGHEVFTDDERRRVVGAFPWLMLLQLLGPLVIDLIKRWLSRE